MKRWREGASVQKPSLHLYSHESTCTTWDVFFFFFYMCVIIICLSRFCSFFVFFLLAFVFLLCFFLSLLEHDSSNLDNTSLFPNCSFKTDTSEKNSKFETHYVQHDVSRRLRKEGSFPLSSSPAAKYFFSGQNQVYVLSF